MKTNSTKSVSPHKTKLLAGIFLLCGLLFSGYTSACTASFTYTAGVNGQYTFHSTSVGFGFPQYFWNPGDGSGWHSGSGTFSYTYLANGRYGARLYATDSICADTSLVDSVIVTNVVTPCNLSASFTYTVTANGVVNFTSTSGGVNAYTQYYWAPGDSNQRVRGASTFTHTYLYRGYYTMWLTVEDTGLSYCIDSIPVTINVNTADSSYCNIHASFTYTTGADGEVTFTNTSTGTKAGDHYYWTLGDTSGTHSGAGPFSYTYHFNGTHNVNLNISRFDSNGYCADSITIPVTVSNACNLEANFTETFDTGVNAGGVKFTSTSVGVNAGTVYRWTFGDGSPTVTGDDTITHKYSFIGYYNVTLFDSNAGGCVDSTTHTIYVYNKDSLQACFTYFQDSLNAGTYNFNAGCSLGTNANTYYKWTPGDGDPSDSGLGMTSYTHTYLHNGPYSATLTIWYTVLPHHPSLRSNPEYDLSSFTQVITVKGVTGVASIVDSKMYTIYPNPSNGSFKIAVNGLTNEKDAQIRISNMMGQVIYQANATVSDGNTLSNISLPNIANGIYLLQIISQDNTYTSRIAIQK